MKTLTPFYATSGRTVHLAAEAGASAGDLALTVCGRHVTISQLTPDSWASIPVPARCKLCNQRARSPKFQPVVPVIEPEKLDAFRRVQVVIDNAHASAAKIVAEARDEATRIQSTSHQQIVQWRESLYVADDPLGEPALWRNGQPPICILRRMQMNDPDSWDQLLALVFHSV